MIARMKTEEEKLAEVRELHDLLADDVVQLTRKVNDLEAEVQELKREARR